MNMSLPCLLAMLSYLAVAVCQLSQNSTDDLESGFVMQMIVARKPKSESEVNFDLAIILLFTRGL